MAEIAEIAMYVFVPVYFVVATVWAFLIYRLFSRLKESHASVWKSLDSPSLTNLASYTTSKLVHQWLWRREYLDLGEPQTVHLASTVRSLELGLKVSFAIFVPFYFLANGTVNRWIALLAAYFANPK